MKIPDLTKNNRKALIISNSYQGSHLAALASGREDFILTERVLRGFNFDTTSIVLDGDIEKMKKITQLFLNSLNDDETSFFYFSGHGDQNNHVNTLYADNGIDKYHLQEEYISLVSKKRGIHIIVLDCCRTQGKGSGTYNFKVNLVY